MWMYFLTFYDFWHPKFQLLTHSALEKWSIDISADTVAGWIQSSKLFTRTKRVWLVQVEITKGVVYYTVMRFVRPEKFFRDGGGTAAYTVYTLYIYVYWSNSEQMSYYAYTCYTYGYIAMGHSNIPIWIICIGLIAHGLHEECGDGDGMDGMGS